MRFMLDYLRPGDRFIDVGANIGLYSIFAAAIAGPSGHVDAFEPAALPAERFQESVDINGLTNVSLHRVAVSDVAGTTNFNVTLEDCTAHISPASQGGTGSDRVCTVRLDEYLPAEPYAMAKLDLEGYEPLAVRGAAGLMKQGKLPVLLLEMIGLSKRYGVSTSDFIAELDALGYGVAVYDPDTRTLKPTERPWEISVDNLLAIQRNQMAFVSHRLLAIRPDHSRRWA